MVNYVLSQDADEDFERLFEYCIDNFGVKKAKSYSNGMKTRFIEIAQNPYRWQAVDYIRPNYRRSVYRNHSIYYVIENEKSIRIVRILGREDIAISLNA